MWALFMAAGVAWIAVVGWVLGQSLDFADAVAAQGVIAEPKTAQTATATVSALIFALPGVGFLVVGWRKRPRRG